MARKPQLTDAGLLSESYGTRPNVVTLREEKAPGTNVVLDFTHAGRRRKTSLGYSVREKDRRRRWVWDWEALERAREAQERMNAELKLGQLRDETRVEHLTVGQAFALYHDQDTGGLPSSKSAVYRHRYTRREWEKWLGKDTPWNGVTPADVWGLIEKYRKRGMAPTARELLRDLRTCYNWLRKKRRIRHLEDPTEGLEIKDTLKGHTPRRPRYAPAEVQRIVKVRYEVDPRFALFLALMEDSGARRDALRQARRSGLDRPLEQPPAEENAPYGWLELPPLKGQDAPLLFLTSYQRREIEAALGSYLRALEEEYQSAGRDYPLFPAARVRGAVGGLIRPRAMRPEEIGVDSERSFYPAQSKAYQPISPARTREWLIEAEQLAGVEHIDGRGYHGMRRMVSDYLYEATDLKDLTTGMAWSSEKIPERIYLERGKHASRARVREAHEKKRKDG